MKTLRSVVILGLLIVAAGYLLSCQSTALTSAKLYIQQENYPKAQEQLEIEVKQNPQNAEAWYLLGYVYGVRGKYKEMNEAFKKCTALSNKFEKDIRNVRRKYWIDNFNAGVRKLQKNQIKEAIKDFKTAILIDPEDANAYKNLGYAYVKTNQDEKAIEAYSQAVKYDSSDTKTMLTLGLEYQRTKKYDKAIELFKRILKLEPNNADAIANLALTYDMMGQPDKALEAYNRALAKNPDNTDLYFNRGLLHYKNNEFKLATEDFKKVLEKNPKDYEALFYVGSAYLNWGDQFKKQRVALEDKGKKDSKIKELKKKEMDKYKVALKYLERARDVRPDDPNVWNNLGIVYVRLGMSKKGVEAFKKVEALQKKIQ